MRSVSIITARLCLAVFFGFFLLNTQAQQNSPFSRYGIGEYYNSQHTISRSMGGLTASYADGVNNNVGQSVNFNNPATYSSFYMVTYDLGFTIDSRTMLSNTPTGKFTSNNFIPSYLAVGIPIKKAKGLGLAFGLKPVSSISYSIENRAKVANDSLLTIYEGSGGLNQVFVGLGKKWKNFSAGFNTGYNFGRKEIATRKTFVNDTVSYYQSISSSSTNFGGVFLSGGLQYEVNLHKKSDASNKTVEAYFLRFGLTGTLQQNLKATQNQIRQTYTVGTNGDIRIDSVQDQFNIKGNIALPSTYTAGVTLHKTVANSRGLFEIWSVGLEYTSTQWTKYRFYEQPDKLSNSYQYRLGVQLSPDPANGSGYWSNVNYRAGFYLGKDYIDPDGNGLKQYGVSFGAGLPIRKWRSYDNQFTVLNTALQFGKRGSSVNNVTESYVQFSIGMSLSDLWFQKRKYD